MAFFFSSLLLSRNNAGLNIGFPSIQVLRKCRVPCLMLVICVNWLTVQVPVISYDYCTRHHNRVTNALLNLPFYLLNVLGSRLLLTKSFPLLLTDFPRFRGNASGKDVFPPFFCVLYTAVLPYSFTQHR